MAAIEITVINNLGTFVGFLQMSNGLTDLGDKARDIMTALQAKVNDLNDLTLVQRACGEITFPTAVLSTSIFKMRLVEETE